jgi:hypothetical protein
MLLFLIVFSYTLYCMLSFFVIFSCLHFYVIIFYVIFFCYHFFTLSSMYFTKIFMLLFFTLLYDIICNQSKAVMACKTLNWNRQHSYIFLQLTQSFSDYLEALTKLTLYNFCSTLKLVQLHLYRKQLWPPRNKVIAKWSEKMWTFL